MKLSILICTIPSRFLFFQRLWAILEPQLTSEVEVIWFGDNKKRSIGDKRNVLLGAARGDYLTFIDDDDRVSPDYIDVILSTIKSRPDADVITFVQMVSVNGSRPKPCYYGVDLPYVDSPDKWTGKPAHTMVWRTSIAASEKFTNRSQGEDTDWVALVTPKVKVQVQLDVTLYHYEYNHRTSERP